MATGLITFLVLMSNTKGNLCKEIERVKVYLLSRLEMFTKDNLEKIKRMGLGY
jgi:hypothetical protein